MDQVPFPSNQNAAATSLRPKRPEKPWTIIKPGEPIATQLLLKFSDGKKRSFALCDLRDTMMDGAGLIQLSIFGMEKFRVTIEGRNLDELYGLLMLGRVKSMTELGKRTFERAESDTAIDKIAIEVFTGPSLI